ncbi:hypothetical protein AA313_de0202086 [Arthrobotrys entomopaga]|nr:hypothetical protein AA313_de0202086 [Arthrobotrys entomopaga]
MVNHQISHPPSPPILLLASKSTMQYSLCPHPLSHIGLVSILSSTCRVLIRVINRLYPMHSRIKHRQSLSSEHIPSTNQLPRPEHCYFYFLPKPTALCAEGHLIDYGIISDPAITPGHGVEILFDEKTPRRIHP